MRSYGPACGATSVASRIASSMAGDLPRRRGAQVPPFGARGGNSGVADADNFGWKLALVIAGHASPALIDTYHSERYAAAVENIEVHYRSALFLTPTRRRADCSAMPCLISRGVSRRCGRWSMVAGSRSRSPIRLAAQYRRRLER